MARLAEMGKREREAGGGKGHVGKGGAITEKKKSGWSKNKKSKKAKGKTFQVLPTGQLLLAS